jgi:hypothetical protein
MSELPGRADEEASLFAIGTTLLRNRRRIARWVFAGGAIAALMVLNWPALYRASASFAPQGADPARSGLASLAGQFGVSLPSSGQTQSPEYYQKLVKSRALLRAIALDTFTVAEMGNRRVPFFELFELGPTASAQREDQAVRLLTRIVGASVSKPTGIVEVAAATKWRSVSLAIVDKVIARVNEFNQNSRRSQAAAERQFIEGRVAVATSELQQAEERLDQFYRRNRQFSGSPELVTERDRLQRVVSQRQQILNMLMQSYEESRLREVRDTPVITVVEPPAVPALPEPRGRTKVGLLGLMLGGFVGVFLVLWKDMMSRRRAVGDPEASEFSNALGAFARDLTTPFRWITGRGPKNTT